MPTEVNKEAISPFITPGEGEHYPLGDTFTRFFQETTLKIIEKERLSIPPIPGAQEEGYRRTYGAGIALFRGAGMDKQPH